MATGAGPGGWSQEGRFPDARPQQGPPGPRPPAKTNPSLARWRLRPSGECPGWGGWWWCRPNFQGWRPRRVDSNCAVVGGRAPGGIDKGRGQEGVRGRSGRGRREKETEMERPKEKNTQRDRGGERDTRREM